MRVRTLIFAVFAAWSIDAGASGAPAFTHLVGRGCLPACESAPWLPREGDEARNPAIHKLLNRPASLWDRIRNGFAMPDLADPAVAKHIAWYAERPQLVAAIVERASLYLFYIVEELERRGMPLEIALLPVVESGFNPMAVSSAQASGLWQFIPETGRKYALPQTDSFDARRDVLASTGAAIDYLEFLFGMHKDWNLALASYNWGEWAVARAVERNRAKGLQEDFGSLRMPSETRHYVPRLHALKQIVLDPEKHGVKLTEIPNEPYFTVVPNLHRLEALRASQLAGLSLEEFRALNPGASGHATRVGERIVLPTHHVETFNRNVERFAEEQAAAAARAARRGKRRR